MLLQRGARDEPRGPLVDRNMGEVFAQDALGLCKLSKRQFRRSLEIIPGPESREGAANAIEYSICRGVLLLLGELKRAQRVCPEIIWSGFENRIEILVRCLEIAPTDVDVGAAQMSLKIFGIDLERLIEKRHGCVLVAPGLQHFRLDPEDFRRVRVGGDRPVYQLVCLLGVLPAEKLGELDLWPCRLRI